MDYMDVVCSHWYLNDTGIESAWCILILCEHTVSQYLLNCSKTLSDTLTLHLFDTDSTWEEVIQKMDLAT